MATLDYGPKPARRVRWRGVLAAILSIVAFVLASSFVSSFGVRTDLGWVDAITGSKRSRTDWGFGHKSAEIIVPSALELRLNKLGVPARHDWRNVKGTYRNVFGGGVGHAHGSAPPIYHLAFADDLLNRFVDASTDAEILEFVRVMQSGTDQQQRAAVHAAAAKALGSLGPPTTAPHTRPAR